MAKRSMPNRCWYTISNGNFKIYNDKIKERGISLDQCVECKFSVYTSSYQQVLCGTRYCNDCFDKLKSKYYCPLCKVDDPNNIVHVKEQIFLDKALMKDSEKMMVKCPDCREEIKLMSLENHALDECKNGWSICSRCENLKIKSLEHDCEDKNEELCTVTSPYKPCDECGKEIDKERKEVELHKCKMDLSDCCPYNCTVEDMTIKEHRQDARLYHLDKSWAILKELKLTDCKRADNSDEYKTWMNSTIEKIKSAIGYSPKDVLALKNEIELLNKELAAEKEIHEEIKTNMLNLTSELLNTNFDGTIMWRIDNFKDCKTRIFSSPFYTSRFGYKMCLLLYPEGDSINKGKAISLFLVIMKGNYDAMLRWPFKQKVTFMLVDQTLKNHKTDTFFPSDSMASFSKPQNDMNLPSGSSSFVKLKEFNENKEKYAKNDIVFIKCTVDCADLHE